MRDGVKLAVRRSTRRAACSGGRSPSWSATTRPRTSVGVQIAQELINKEKVVATVGFINTGVALAAQRFYQEAEIPVINNVATGSVITKQFAAPDHKANYVFRNSANDTIQSAMIADEAIKKHGFTKPAILADCTNYGQLGRDDLEKALGKRGIKPVAIEKFNIGDTDMTRAAAARQGSRRRRDPDLRHRAGAGADRQRHGQARLESADDRLLDSVDGEFHRHGRRQRRRRDDAADLHPAADDAQAQGFIEAYQKAYKVDRMPSPVSAAQGYDSIYCWRRRSTRPESTEGPQDPGGARGPATKNRWRRDHLRQAVLRRPTTRRSPATSRCSAQVKGGRVVPAQSRGLEGDEARAVKPKS